MTDKQSTEVSEVVVRIDGHPKYSGTRIGAQHAIFAALSKAQAEGRAEPVVKVTERVVETFTDPNDNTLTASKVSEHEITL